VETKEHLLAQVGTALKSIQLARELILSFFQLKDTKCAAGIC
jgi:hypothetical protein